MDALSYTDVDRMDLVYRVVLKPNDNSGYDVIVPAFPTAHICGGTVANALAHAREIIELEIEDRRGRGEPIPPSDIDTLIVETITITRPAV